MSYGTVQAEKMTTESGYSLGAGNASSFKNRIINGGMTIAQRGTSTTSSAGTFIDMWRYNITSPSSLTVSQSSTAPTGFNNSLLVTVTTGGAIGSNLNYVSQAIEGYNCADFGFGTANAKTVTISFWVRSSITGTFGGSLRNYAPSVNYRGYPFTYTINAANTWEQKTVTIAGDGVTGAGDWNTTNTGSLTVFFDLGTQSGYTAAANSWITQNVVGATGTQTSLVATNGATWYVTGVQLEAGTVATSFDFRSYGTELALCYRYYRRFISTNTYTSIGVGVTGNATQLNRWGFTLDTPMRTAPTPSFNSCIGWNSAVGGAVSVGSNYSTTNNIDCDLITSGLSNTAGFAAKVLMSGTSAYVELTGAEL